MTTLRRMRWAQRLCPVLTALLLGFFSAAAHGQDRPAAQADPLGEPTERGVRLTPEMVRTMTSSFAKEVLARQYEMDESKVDQAGERIARRIMAAAHQNGPEAQALIEFIMAEMIERQARNQSGEAAEMNPFMDADFGQEFARHLLPLMPAIRDLMRDAGRDILPLLPLKQQLKMGAQMTAAAGIMEGFEQNLQRWAKGEAKPGDDPFSKNESPEPREPGGETNALKSARTSAENELDKEARVKSMWEQYLADTKKFYALDQGQCATADSILREYLDRLNRTLESPEWRDGMYRARLWLSISGAVGLARGPLPDLLNRQYQGYMDPINELGNQFRLRLDQLPTTAQRSAAEARVAEGLAEHGYEFTPTADEN